MVIFSTVRARRWIVASISGWLSISLVSHAAATTKSEQSTETNIAGSVATSEDILRNWTTFRGPGANAHAPRAEPPLHWNAKEGTNVLWKSAVPKHGMSSPIVWENRLFLTGADDSSRQIYCYDTDTGKLLWIHDVKNIPGSPPGGTLPKVLDETGFAAPTATTDGQFVAAIFGTGELVCVDMKGERVWARHLGIPANHYGHASSLICHKNLLMVQYDQKDHAKLLTFDLTNGQPMWEVKRGAMSWSSPIVVDNRGRTELILTNSKAVDSYDPATGKLLWRVECLAGEVASSGAYADGIVCVANENATASAIDIRDQNSEPKILWQWDEALPDAASLVVNEELVIVPTGYGVVSALSAKNGKVQWQHEFEDGFSSSPILVKDRVYILSLSGVMQIFKMADKFVLIGSAELGEDTYATPAFVGGRIYIRGIAHLFCIEEQK